MLLPYLLLMSYVLFYLQLKGERDGIWTWHRVNRLFNWLPLAALIEKKIICMHGGIGRSINHVEQIENLQRPITMEAGSVVLMDLLWSAFQLLLLSDYYSKILFIICWGHGFMIYLSDAYWRSDPTENDSVEGLRPNARGPGLVTFGVSIICSSFPFFNSHFSCWFPWFMRLTCIIATAW